MWPLFLIVLDAIPLPFGIGKSLYSCISSICILLQSTNGMLTMECAEHRWNVNNEEVEWQNKDLLAPASNSVTAFGFPLYWFSHFLDFVKYRIVLGRLKIIITVFTCTDTYFLIFKIFVQIACFSFFRLIPWASFCQFVSKFSRHGLQMSRSFPRWDWQPETDYIWYDSHFLVMQLTFLSGSHWAHNFVHIFKRPESNINLVNTFPCSMIVSSFYPLCFYCTKLTVLKFSFHSDLQNLLHFNAAGRIPTTFFFLFPSHDNVRLMQPDALDRIPYV